MGARGSEGVKRVKCMGAVSKWASEWVDRCASEVSECCEVGGLGPVLRLDDGPKVIFDDLV